MEQGDHGSSASPAIHGGMSETSPIGAEGAANSWRGSPKPQLGGTHSTVCGVVRAVHGRQAEVAVDEGGCGRCHETGGCGGHNLGRMFAGLARTYRVDTDFCVCNVTDGGDETKAPSGFQDQGSDKTDEKVSNSLGVRVGERVTIAVAAGSVRRAANLAYGVPLLAAIVGALTGNSLFGDAGAIGGALLAFAGAMFYVRRRSWATAGNPAGEPHIVSRSQPDQEVGHQ